MTTETTQHPAVLFGAWLKGKRRNSGIVAREFAGMIDLSPAEYAEVECGIGIPRWIKSKQERLIAILLRCDDAAGTEAEYMGKLNKAREVKGLEFGDVFSRDQLQPVRCSTNKDEQIDAKTREAILDAVFKRLE